MSPRHRSVSPHHRSVSSRHRSEYSHYGSVSSVFLCVQNCGVKLLIQFLGLELLDIIVMIGSEMVISHI